MPSFIEARVQHLCTEAIAAQSEEEIDRITKELRSALEEHVRLAKESLEAQAASIALLDSGNA
jgi:F0F1-type ATP synthase membrane subunit b/b'